VVTLLEWNSLDRDPLKTDIMSPFIERHINVSAGRTANEPTVDAFTEREESPETVVRYDVEFKFNGPLFLAGFFIPMLIFNGIGMLWNRLHAID
jgi:hypothetical protein